VNLLQLTAVIKHSALHLSGDTGTLHLAVATQTPVVAWFWPNPGIHHWVPSGPQYQVLVGSSRQDASFIQEIPTSELVGAAKIVLAARA
jgi:ADP-heptose:LPS heptosyltransferase